MVERRFGLAKTRQEQIARPPLIAAGRPLSLRVADSKSHSFWSPSPSITLGAIQHPRGSGGSMANLSWMDWNECISQRDPVAHFITWSHSEFSIKSALSNSMMKINQVLTAMPKVTAACPLFLILVIIIFCACPLYLPWTLLLWTTVLSPEILI